jgi:putative ABC transport system permease protein
MFKDYFFLALGNLRHRGLRSWLTMLGIFIGIAAVVSLISMGQGLQATIEGQLGSLSADTLTIQNKGSGFGPPGSTVVEKLNDNDVRIIEDVPDVDFVIHRLIKVGSLEFNDVSGFGYGVSMPEDEEKREFIYGSFDFEAEEGRLLRSGDTGKVLLGNGFLDTEDFGKELRVGKTVKVNGEDFEIVGIMKQSRFFQFNSMIFIMFDDLKELFDTGDEYDFIIVKVQDRDRIEVVADEIERKLRDDRNEKPGEESFTIQTPIQAAESVGTILNIINLIVVGIAGISLLVGGVGIANTMYTSVVERTSEIGVMKAVGAKNKDILYIFLIEAGLLGLVGGIAGAVIGLGGALLIAAIANQAFGADLFTVGISYSLLIVSVFFSFIVGVLSGILPALQASKLNVVDALRK